MKSAESAICPNAFFGEGGGGGSVIFLIFIWIFQSRTSRCYDCAKHGEWQSEIVPTGNEVDTDKAWGVA